MTQAKTPQDRRKELERILPRKKTAKWFIRCREKWMYASYDKGVGYNKAIDACLKALTNSDRIIILAEE